MVCLGLSINIQKPHWSHRLCYYAEEHNFLHDFCRSFFSLSVLLTFGYFFVSGVTPMSGVAVPAQNLTKIQNERYLELQPLTD